MTFQANLKRRSDYDILPHPTSSPMFSISLSSSTLFNAIFLFSYLVNLSKAQNRSTLEDEPKLVPVILGVMSRCPDALLCESVFDDVLKQVGPKMSLEMTYIAKYVTIV